MGLLLRDVDYLKWRVPLIIMACLQSFLASGIFYGWASLYLAFLDEGVYSELCPNPHEICDKQKDALHAIYVVASSFNLLAQLPWGFILDYFGPRLCCALSNGLVIVGFLVMGASGHHFNGYRAAVCLIAGAGPGVQISLFHLSVLFPERENTILAIVSGAFNLGFVVFLIFKLVLSHGITLESTSLYYCVPLIVMMLFGISVWPDAPLNLQTLEEDNEAVDVSPLVETTPLTRKAVRRVSVTDPTIRFNPIDIGLKEQVLSVHFVMLLAWFSICLFWANFYVGSVVEQLWVKTGNNHDATDRYTAIFNLLLPVGVTGIPIFGWITDKMGFPAGILITTLFGVVFAACDLPANLTLQIVVFLAYSFFRSFLFSVMFGYIAYEFTYRYFGVLSGIVLSTGAVFGLLQYLLLRANLGWDIINRLQFVTLAASIFYAVYLYYREREKSHMEILEENHVNFDHPNIKEI